MSEGWWVISGTIVSGALTTLSAWLLQRQRFSHENELHRRKQLDKENAKEFLGEMLNHRTHIERSFEALRRPVGGFSDDELRRLLVEIGATRQVRNDGTEWWRLKSRKEEWLASKEN